ncbi:MAG: exopolysaccharide Pel transporter PelG [Planctomycetota bacterium]
MAGIGFELKRMLDERQGLFTRVRAYACASLIAAGPWVMTVFTLAVLNAFGLPLKDRANYEIFRGLVTYVFAASLVVVGLFHMAATRWVADRIYMHQYDRVLPAFVVLLSVLASWQSLTGSLFCWWAGFDLRLAMVVVTLYVIVSLTWVALIWLSIVREYDVVLRAYVFGTLLSILCILWLGLSRSAREILVGYSSGQALTLMLLLRAVVRGMQADGKRDLSVLGSFALYPRLAAIGFLYHLAIWVDKVILWITDGVGPHRFIRFHPLYDSCTLLGYLTVVPALAVNLIRLETSFYERYRRYYGSVLNGAPLRIIEQARQRMLGVLSESTVRLLRAQGAVSVLAIVFAHQITGAFGLPPAAVPIFRLACLGAFFHVLFLLTMTTQLYFDLQREAHLSALVFLVLSAGLGLASARVGLATYGLGYAVSAFVALLVAFQLLRRSLGRLDFLTFTRQPAGMA